VPTPDFVLFRQPPDLHGLSLPPPVFVKPVAEGTGKGITAASKVQHPPSCFLCERLLAQFNQPVLIETFRRGGSSRSGWSVPA
jgi:D-alanine-D-alanine ligase